VNSSAIVCTLSLEPTSANTPAQACHPISSKKPVGSKLTRPRSSSRQRSRTRRLCRTRKKNQRITDGVLTLRTAKTGTPVRLPLHPDALAALAAIQSGHYYFWFGHGKTKSCVGDYQRAFKTLYELAEVENGHAHRWRDTFAAELLLKRVPIADVSVWRGSVGLRCKDFTGATFERSARDSASRLRYALNLPGQFCLWNHGVWEQFRAQ
jgi:hypothetical protein